MKTIKEFYLSPNDGTITYEYNDDTNRSFNLDDLILTDSQGQVQDSIQFLTDLSDPAHKEGLLFYDKNDHCLAYFNEDENVKVSLSREQLVRVYNNTGVALIDGQAVYVNGAFNGWPTVTLANASSKIASQSTLGVITGNIAVNTYGYICSSGIVHDINTAAYTPGTLLYLSTSFGVISSVPPVQPNYRVEVGTVLTQGTTDGALFVHVDRKEWLPSLELEDTTASTLVPLVPTLLKPSTVTVNNGFLYNPSLGEITITESRPYTIDMQFNFRNGNSNKVVYFYIEEYVAGVWTPVKYSARMLQLSNVDNLQYLLSYSKYYIEGQMIRLYYWSNNSTVYMETSNLPGTPAGTLVLPAFKLNMA